jgi:predicted amidophosphoribosyltransferase
MWAALRPWIFPVSCLGCGVAHIALCAACAPGPADRRSEVVGGASLTALGSYDGLLRRAIVALKSGERAYLDPFVGLLADCIAPNVPLVPLPTSRARRMARGFDVAVELARRVAARRGSDAAEILVKRGGAQHGRDRRTRLAAGGRFAIKPGAALPEIAIVVDDVCTTGATLIDGITTLRAAGIAVIGAAVLARTQATRNSRPMGTVLSLEENPLL